MHIVYAVHIIVNYYYSSLVCMIKFIDELPLLLFVIGIFLLVIYLEGDITSIMLFGIPFFLVVMILLPLYLIKATRSCIWGHQIISDGHGIVCKKCGKTIISKED